MVCPLHWGLGHASRCAALTYEMMKLEMDVTIAGSNRVNKFIASEFPRIKTIHYPGYKVRYSQKFTGFAILLQAPFLLLSLIKEYFYLKKIVNKNQFDIIISDSRLGGFHKKVYSILLIHQLHPVLPNSMHFAEGILEKLIRFFANKFDECWIPDLSSSLGIAGKLSHPVIMPDQFKYIGTLSRFNYIEPLKDLKIDILVILSGPEPQRSILEKKLIHQLRSHKGKIILLRGLNNKMRMCLSDNFEVLPFASGAKLATLIKGADVIIARAGYSTITDLLTTGNKAILIPTPGQTEQEYLAKHLQECKQFVFAKQHKFKLEKSLSQFSDEKMGYMDMIADNEQLLRIALSSLIEIEHRKNR